MSRLRSVRWRVVLLLCGGLGSAAGTRADAAQFPEPTAELRLGQLDGPPARTFGRVEDVRPVGSGRFVVLDAYGPAVRMYDAAGRLLAATGREGEGPGEFESPVALASTPERLYIADTGNTRVQEFDVRDRELEFRRAFPLPFYPRDLCTLDDRLYVAAFHEGHTVHELSPDGDIVRSFGEPAAADEVPEGWPRRILRESRSVGFLACSTAPNTVVSLGLNGPELHAYTPDGAVRWTATLRDYSRMRAGITERGTMGYDPDPDTGGQHQAAGLVVDDERVFAQLVFIDGEVSRDEAPSRDADSHARCGRGDGGGGRPAKAFGRPCYAFLRVSACSVSAGAAPRGRPLTATDASWRAASAIKAATPPTARPRLARYVYASGKTASSCPIGRLTTRLEESV